MNDDERLARQRGQLTSPLPDPPKPPGRPVTRLVWDFFGASEAGMPEHLPMGVTEAGQGPTDDEDAHHYVCWVRGCRVPADLGPGMGMGRRT